MAAAITVRESGLYPRQSAPERKFADAMADRAGFEPAVAVTPRTLSKRVP